MKYDYFQEEKLEYEDIEIPDQLLLMVRQTIASDRRKKAAKQRIRIIKTVGSIAAILFLCLTIGVNSSYAFAETAVKIPVVKSVAKAVIVRSYKADIIALDEQNSKKPKQEPNVEQAPEEALPAVSDNNVILEEEEPVQPAEQEPEEILEGFDAWKAEMTPEKFKEVTELYTSDMEERYADTPEKLRTILLAELPEKEIFLYGYHEDGKVTGTALLVKDTYRYFDWNYMNSTKKLPEISLADTDGDGEEELVVFLYNGEPQKKIISKEDIEEPGESKNTETTEGTVPAQDKEMAEGASSDQSKGTTESAAFDQSKEAAENTASDKNKGTTENTTPDKSEEADGSNRQNTVSGDNAEEPDAENNKTSLSGNDIKNPSEPEEAPKQQAGEIWVVSLKEENQPASLLSVNDYESQILRQLKAEYEKEEGAIRLYLMEEPLGEPVKVSFEEEEKQAYEALRLAPEREFITEKGFFLNFDVEAVFSNSDGEKIRLPLKVNLKAEIHLEDGSLTVENIKEK